MNTNTSRANLCTLAGRNRTTIQNRVLEDPTLSFTAKGIFAYFLSRPDGQAVSVADILRHGAEGEDEVYPALEELKQAGHIR